jgi:hypothetical protein
MDKSITRIIDSVRMGQASEIGTRIGKAIADTCRTEGIEPVWTGIEAQDGDLLTAAGIEPRTQEWSAAEDAAEAAFEAEFSDR